MKTPNDYLLHALNLATRGRLTTSPNPMVGCVIVKNGHIVGEGYHQFAGGDHAEIIALRAASHEAKDATVYITLEPCCHHGKTPPCTAALIQAGVKEVYVATLDPNPLVSGKGIAALEAANIAVHLGIESKAAEKLNEIFMHYMKFQRPFVIAKWAMSLDGKTITHLLDNKKISNELSHKMVHELRQQVDAILIGANTAREDNPFLTVRGLDIEPLRQPLRVILSSDGNLPLNLHLFNPQMSGKTMIATTAAISEKMRMAFKEKEIEVVILPANEKKRVDLRALLVYLGKIGISSLLVEGGNLVRDHFFAEKLVNQVKVYLAPVVIGGLSKKISLNDLSYSPLGGDFYFHANCEVGDV